MAATALVGGEETMPGEVSPGALRDLLSGSSQFALIDVREAGEYNSSHIPGASLIPRRLLESQVGDAVPHAATPVVVCDDDGRRAELAAETLERLGYGDVSHLAGGINRWVTEHLPTEWGVNVPSKDFGERVEVENGVPEITAVELQERMDRGDKLVVLDTRTPEEYNRFCIPGGRSVPGAELPLRITDIVRESGDDTTVIVNCAGRTRSIIGTRTLQRMGMGNVFGLQNGTSGWVLAGYELETGADRFALPAPSAEGRAEAEDYARRVASEDGVQFVDVDGLRALMDRRGGETVYLIDVRTQEEHESGHVPGFRWFPGGQAVQRSDEAATVHNAPVVFACDGIARAAVTASWFRQMGFGEVYALEGGTSAWTEAGHSLETGLAPARTLGLDEARTRVRRVSPTELDAAESHTVLFVDTSQDFAQGHVPGSRWAPRGWLELWVGDLAPSTSEPVTVTCLDGVRSTLAAATLQEMGYTDVAVLDGGLRAWREAGLPVEMGLSGVMSSPNDVVLSGPDRNYADMMNYLRWEEALGEKYERL